MAPILASRGGVSARAYGFTGGVAAPGDYESIQTITLGSAQATISFTSIPSTYRHLQLRAISRATQAAGGTDIRITFNGDSGSNYFWHHLYGNGAAASATAGTSSTYIRNMNNVDGSYSNIFQGAVYDILEYASTSKNKTLRCLTGFDANGDGHIKLLSGAWNSTSAINQIDFTTPGTTFSQYTTFALYGLKG